MSVHTHLLLSRGVCGPPVPSVHVVGESNILLRASTHATEEDEWPVVPVNNTDSVVYPDKWTTNTIPPPQKKKKKTVDR